jgi:leucine dehydrogenase
MPVETLGGRYIIAEDSGTSAADMEMVRRTTRHVAGIAEGGAGDPSPATAFGVYQGIRAAILHRFGADDFTGLTIAVQGLGAVGRHLCRHLHDAGARLIVADIDAARAAEVEAEFGAKVVAPERIVDEPAEVFAPCALGAVINDATVARLKTAIVAGAANNQLDRPDHGRALAARSILYAPDYVINAGGIINIAHEGPNYDRQTAFRHVARIRETLLGIFSRAETEGLTPEESANRIARERLHAGTRAAA